MAGILRLHKLIFRLSDTHTAQIQNFDEQADFDDSS